ncbi:tetratricopeptide repeat-containing sensor histidine kinase [Marinoscillum sp. MHG1-6]|uniref:tetratricopeptide repeat-containing sensor histidine kinase n=1 Tax=Marinoscillum sp. MHG1-6 TaxID=2959627 RepID=UPI002157B634|nr:tetratricopeptide repeat-containing sensor histidine kinase [Marinoscillum sp. MHG1-6]
MKLRFSFIFLYFIIHSADASLDSLVLAARISETPQELIDHYLMLSEEFTDKDFDISNTYLQAAYYLSDSLKYPDGIINSYIVAGIYFTKSGQFDTAFALLKKSLVQAKKHQNKLLKGRAHLFLGDFYWLSQVKSSLAHYYLAWECFHSINDSHYEIITDLKLGYVYQKTGDFYNALESYNQAKELSKLNNDAEQHASSYRHLGLFYQYRGDYQRALHYFNRAIEIGEQNNLKIRLSEFHYELGDLYRLMDNYEAAENCLNTSTQLCSEEGLRPWIYNLLHYGLLYMDMGKYDLAHDYLDNVIDESEKTGNEFALAEAITALGRVSYKLGNYNESREILIRAFNLSDSLEAQREKMNTLQSLAELEEESGNYNKSLEYYKTFVALRDSLNYFKSNEDIAFLEAEFQFKYQEDSIQHVAELQKASIEAEIQRQSKRQAIFIITLVLLFVLLAVVIIWIKTRQRAHQKLIELLAAVRDQHKKITQQRDQLQDTLEKLESTQEQLMISERKAAVSILAAGLGHEMNNPLNIILGGVWRLKDYLKNDDVKLTEKEQLDVLGSIDDGVMRINKIVKNLIYFDSNSQDLIHEVDIHEIIDSAISKMSESLHKKDIELGKMYFAPPAKVLCSFIAVQRIFVNLLQNAVDAIEHTGKIEITTEVIDADEIRIIINDNGTGIDSEDMEKIGKPFFTTKSPGQGFGLGLYISRDLAAAYGGTINLYPNHTGVKVVVVFPISHRIATSDLMDRNFKNS